MARTAQDGTTVERLAVRALVVPTETPEADGTLAWISTTIVLVELQAGGMTGLGYSYASRAAASVIGDVLAPVVLGRDVMSLPAIWGDMVRAVRNLGREGVGACAISAVDAASWDLKAKLLGLPLCGLLGEARDAAPIYGSGGFTNYAHGQLRDQLAGWAEGLGCRWVKMKIGADPKADPARIAAAREAAGEAELMVDANGAFSRKAALGMAEVCARAGVTWFEEPVSSDDVAGLRWLRDRAPSPIEIAAGEYGWDVWRLRGLLEAGAVDVLQADATRCLGLTGFMKAAALAEAFQTPLSAHCAPALHLHAAVAAAPLRHVEWFFDHARIESMLFDGAPVPAQGEIRPDRSRPGLGLELKRADVERLAGRTDSLFAEWRQTP